MRWAGHVARMEEDRGVHRVLVGKPEGKRPLGRARRRWEGNIKMDLQEVGGGLGDWMELAQDSDRWWALVGTVRDFRVPQMRGISWLTAKFTFWLLKKDSAPWSKWVSSVSVNFCDNRFWPVPGLGNVCFVWPRYIWRILVLVLLTVIMLLDF